MTGAHSSRYVPAGILLAEPTYRLGERRIVFFYCCIAVALQIVFWLQVLGIPSSIQLPVPANLLWLTLRTSRVPNIIAASVAISFIGFFTDPLFATGIASRWARSSSPTSSTPPHWPLYSSLRRWEAPCSPVVTGVVASRRVSVLQPILVSILTATTVSRLLVPWPKSSSGGATLQSGIKCQASRASRAAASAVLGGRVAFSYVYLNFDI